MNLDTSSLGSYAFSTFTDTSRELERLESQANLAWGLESVALDAHGLQDANSVLDLACGPGVITRRIATQVPQAQVTGLDYEPKLLEVAQSATPLSLNNRPRFSQGDVYDLPDDLGVFDFVYARFLFQHLERPEQALREMKRTLTPRGRLLIVDVDDRDLTSEPHYAPFTEFVEQVAQAQQRSGGDRMVGGKIPTLLKEAGFTHLRVEKVELNSSMFGLRKFFEITTAFKLEQLPRSERAYHQRKLDGIRKDMELSGTEIRLAIHCVSGQSQ